MRLIRAAESILVVVVAAGGCGGEEAGEVPGAGDDITQVAAPLVSADVNHFELALHWAPVHIQGTAGRQDWLSRFDYDGDFKGANNWDNLNNGTFDAAVYYTLAESSSHFFIHYGFFHPQDADTGFCDTAHENDLEAMVALVRKDGTQFGRLEAVLTGAHGHTFPYSNDSRITTGTSASHAVRTMQLADTRPGETHRRPFTYQEPAGHGLYHCGERTENVPAGTFCAFQTANLPNCNALTGTFIRYVPTRALPGFSSQPASGTTIQVSYRLIDLTALTGMFARRFNLESFGNWSTSFPTNLEGDCGSPDCTNDAAQMPWGTPWGRDPAGFANGQFTFTGLSLPTSQYVRNDYADGGNVCSASGKPFVSSTISSACTQAICVADPFCCSGAWDSVCVGRVLALCGGLNCSNCAHATNVTGGALAPSCSQCVSDVCNRDPFCCANSWDALCVGEARVCTQVRFEVHQSDRGWVLPCTQGDDCGVVGSGARLEAVRVYDPPNGARVCYQTHVQGNGWTPTVCSGATSGTQGAGLRMEAVKMTLVGGPVGSHICYSANVPPDSFQPEVCDGVMAGTTGQSRRMESLRVRIVGP